MVGTNYTQSMDHLMVESQFDDPILCNLAIQDKDELAISDSI